MRFAPRSTCAIAVVPASAAAIAPPVSADLAGLLARGARALLQRVGEDLADRARARAAGSSPGRRRRRTRSRARRPARRPRSAPGSSVSVTWNASAREWLKPSAARKRSTASRTRRRRPTRRRVSSASSPSSSSSRVTGTRAAVVIGAQTIGAAPHTLFGLSSSVRPWHRVALAMFAVGWGANQFSPMLVVYRDELGLSDQTRALLFGVYAVGLIPGLLLGGSASDRRGPASRSSCPFVLLSPVATLLLVALPPRDARASAPAGSWRASAPGVVFGAATAWVRELSEGEALGVAAQARRDRADVRLRDRPAGGVGDRRVRAAPAVGAVPPASRARDRGRAADPARRRSRACRARRGRCCAPAVCRSPRFVRTVAIVAPWVFAAPPSRSRSCPTEVGGGRRPGAAGGRRGRRAALLTGVAIQPLARRLEDEHARSRARSAWSSQQPG